MLYVSFDPGTRRNVSPADQASSPAHSPGGDQQRNASWPADYYQCQRALELVQSGARNQRQRQRDAFDQGWDRLRGVAE